MVAEQLSPRGPKRESLMRSWASGEKDAPAPKFWLPARSWVGPGEIVQNAPNAFLKAMAPASDRGRVRTA
jgi:hypothetical protein